MQEKGCRLPSHFLLHLPPELLYHHTSITTPGDSHHVQLVLIMLRITVHLLSNSNHRQVVFELLATITGKGDPTAFFTPLFEALGANIEGDKHLLITITVENTVIKGMMWWWGHSQAQC